MNAASQKYAPASVETAHTVLSGALAQAVARKLIPDDPAAGVDLPRPRKPDAPRARTAAQARAFLEGTIDEPDHALFRLLLDAQLRIGEAAALAWDDVDLARGAVRVRRTLTRDGRGAAAVGAAPKTDSSRRTVAIAPETVAALCAGPLWRDLGYAFDRGDCAFAHPDTVRARFSRAVARLGLPDVGLHGLGQTGATLLILAGVPLKVVSERLGHKGIAITADAYAHVTDEADRSASDVLARLLAG